MKDSTSQKKRKKDSLHHHLAQSSPRWIHRTMTRCPGFYRCTILGRGSWCWIGLRRLRVEGVARWGTLLSRGEKSWIHCAGVGVESLIGCRVDGNFYSSQEEMSWLMETRRFDWSYKAQVKGWSWRWVVGWWAFGRGRKEPWGKGGFACRLDVHKRSSQPSLLRNQPGTDRDPQIAATLLDAPRTVLRHHLPLCGWRINPARRTHSLVSYGSLTGNNWLFIGCILTQYRAELWDTYTIPKLDQFPSNTGICADNRIIDPFVEGNEVVTVVYININNTPGGIPPRVPQ